MQNQYAEKFVESGHIDISISNTVDFTKNTAMNYAQLFP